VTVAASAQHVQRGLGCAPGGGWHIVSRKRITAPDIPRGLYMVIRRASLCLLGYTARSVVNGWGCLLSKSGADRQFGEICDVMQSRRKRLAAFFQFSRAKGAAKP